MAFQEYQFIEVSLTCSDCESMEKFWVDLFDAKVIFRGYMLGQPFTRLLVCGISLIFRQNPNFQAPLGPGKEFLFENHLGLRVHDLDASIAELESKGAHFVLSPAIVRQLQKTPMPQEGGQEEDHVSKSQDGKSQSNRKYLETTYIAPPLTAQRIASGEFKHDVAILVGPDNLWIELNQIKEPTDTAWYPGSEKA